LGFAGIAQAQIVFNVDPSGDLTGETDYVNVVKAFESAKAAGPSNVVELGEGTFIINKVIQVENFDGTFRGAGKGLTVVQNKYVEDERFPAADFPLPAIATLFAFYATTAEERGGSADNPANIAISDMTLKEIGLPEPYKFHEGQPWVPTFGDFIYVAGRVVASTNQGTPAFINVSFANLEVIGEIDSSYPWGYNASYGLSTKGWLETTRTWVESEGGWIVEQDSLPVPISGTFTWTNLSFAKLETPIAVYEAIDSSVTISDIDASDVLWIGIHVWANESSSRTSTYDISNVAMINPPSLPASSAISFWDNDAVAVSITDCDITNASTGIDFSGSGGVDVSITDCDITNASTGIYSEFVAPGTQSTIVIAHNDMHGVGRGVDVRDYPMAWGVGASVDAVIAHNKIDLDGTGPWWGGAVYSRFVTYGVIENNVITGHVLVSAINIRGEGNWLIGNNVQNVTSEFGEPPIYLWDTAINNLVVGSGNLAANVADDTDDPSTREYDGANILVGVNNMKMNVGQYVRDAMANENFDE